MDTIKFLLSNKLSIPVSQENLSLSYKTENIISNLLTPLGFNEIMNNSLNKQ